MRCMTIRKPVKRGKQYTRQERHFVVVFSVNRSPAKFSTVISAGNVQKGNKIKRKSGNINIASVHIDAFARKEQKRLIDRRVIL